MLRLLADGMSVAGIAKQLYVSRVDGEDPHLQAVREARRGQPRPGLMTALRLGLLEAPDAPKF